MTARQLPVTPSLQWHKFHTEHHRGRSKSVSQHQYQSLVYILKVGNKLQRSTEAMEAGCMWHLHGWCALQAPGEWKQFGRDRAEWANLTQSFPWTSLAWEDHLSSFHPQCLSSSSLFPACPMSWVLPYLPAWAPSLGNGKHDQWPVPAGEDKHHLWLLLDFSACNSYGFLVCLSDETKQ